jgi:hypothetical protein
MYIQVLSILSLTSVQNGDSSLKSYLVFTGTGDYGHLTIDHSAVLLRQFQSLYHYSGQGFEASHKLHRQLYSRATNHDASGPGQSCKLNYLDLINDLITSTTNHDILLYVYQNQCHSWIFAYFTKYIYFSFQWTRYSHTGMLHICLV